MVEPIGERLLSELPELGADDELVFSCHPGVPCFNACCADLDLLLSPYDAWRLRRTLNLAGGSFVDRYTRREREPATGFPLVYLAMSESSGQPCPFVRPAGCTVYDDRPSPCRTYPLGRGTRLGPAGEVCETFVLVRESHCQGFAATDRWTPRRYMAAQGLAPYNQANDAFMRLLARWQDSGRLLADAQADLVFTVLYAPERLGELLAAIGESARRDERVAALMVGDEAGLALAYGWLADRLGL